MKFGTKALHAGIKPDPSTGAIMTPIFQTSTYVQEAPGNHKGYEYARTQNPTRDALQTNLAALENGRYATVFASGLAAIDTLVKTLKPTDEIICSNDLYGGTYRLLERVYKKLGIITHFVDLANEEELDRHFNPNTKWVWVETPTNPMMNIVDIARVVELAHARGVKVAVDNTFASPYLQNPLDLGADLVMHSITKYIAGHSDVIMGCLITNHEELHQDFLFLQNSCGGVPGPQDCFLALRGIKTLHLRMREHCRNGKIIAEYLRDHPRIDKVYWPGFSDHRNHDIARKQMKDFGGMISFTLKEDSIDKAFKIASSMEIFSLAESLGGVESLVGHPATMTHASIPREERLKVGLVDTLIRLSVGVEDSEDLLADLQRVLG